MKNESLKRHSMTKMQALNLVLMPSKQIQQKFGNV